MDSAPATSIPIAEIDLRSHAKERLYVICQVGGWGFFFTLQAVFSVLFSKKDESHDSLEGVTILVVVTAVGLLLTHYARPLITWWGWKQLGWTSIPAVLLAIHFMSWVVGARMTPVANASLIPWVSVSQRTRAKEPFPPRRSPS